ncbi:nucleic acid/nucleotide deaminase domain-containing protein [Streptomyces sp. LS1784]|uniref:WXG100-like domain-containing protein n=1 Tax=Streptomyces sp. LS1784 TaxID=2851533 RepID=UPI001CCA5FFC|nr:nucleic acid/nucleotide deaminase domain-containing protein [Streptomyces sp. LS1784]
MGVVLPTYLDTALDVIGVSWPNVDEDDYRHMATELREFSHSLETGTGDLHNALVKMVGTNEGPAIEAMEAHWRKVKDNHLKKLVEIGHLAADGLDTIAVLIEGAKLAAIVQLGILAAEIAAAIAAAPITLGLSALEGVAGRQVCRVAVKRILKEVERAVVDHMTATVLGPLEDALGAMAGDLVVQLGANALDLQHGVDLKQTTAAGAASMQLNSAGGGGSSDGPAPGQIKVDLNSYKELDGAFSQASTHFNTHTADKLHKARRHQNRTRGKDAIANAANAVVDKTIEGIKKGLSKAGHHVGENMKSGVQQMAKSHVEHDGKTAKHFHQIHRPQPDRDALRAGLGPTPVYHMKDNGVIERLTPTGPAKLTADDRKLLGASLNLNSRDAVPRRPVNPNNPYSWDHDKTPKEERPRKESTLMGFYDDELSRATQLARHEAKKSRGPQGSYGNYGIKDGKLQYTSNNYASLRVENDAGKFILVGRSFQPIHSEKVLGIPFLQNGTGGHVKDLYTEREPCSGSSDCKAWVPKWLPHVNVFHSVEFGASEESMARGTKEMEDHLNRIIPYPRANSDNPLHLVKQIHGHH